MEYHRPVLLKQAIDLLRVVPGGCYIDATVGGGGHAREILERSEPGGRLLGIDQDPMALEAAGANLAAFGQRLLLRHGNFRDIARQARAAGFDSVEGVLFDLGVSSAQIDRPERGFSFQSEGPLDMRMGQEGQSAKEILDRITEEDLADLIFSYSQERQSRRIARAIVRARQRGVLTTTLDLRRAILASGPAMPQKTLARVFQALRIAVNDELASLMEGLRQARGLLSRGGRLVVISYHSLEDALVKGYMKEEERPCTCPPKMTVCCCGAIPSLKILTPRAVRPDDLEACANPRSRSARMRAAERL